MVILNTGVSEKKPLDLQALNSLKVLELRNITVWCKYYDEDDLLSPDGDEAMIQLALFNLYRINPQLIQSCFFAEAFRLFKPLLCCHYVVSSPTDQTIHAVVDVVDNVVLHKSKGPAVRDRNSWAGFY